MTHLHHHREISVQGQQSREPVLYISASLFDLCNSDACCEGLVDYGPARSYHAIPDFRVYQKAEGNCGVSLLSDDAEELHGERTE
jgi:hypothetical protein